MKSMLVAVVVCTLGFAGVAWTHHSYAIFDMSKTLTIEGTVKEFQWSNPHAWIEVMVDTPEGAKQYSIEGHNLRALKAMGWTFNSLKPGDKVTIEMHPFRTGAPGGSLATAKLPDGRKLGELSNGR